MRSDMDGERPTMIGTAIRSCEAEKLTNTTPRPAPDQLFFCGFMAGIGLLATILALFVLIVRFWR